MLTELENTFMSTRELSHSNRYTSELMESGCLRYLTSGVLTASIFHCALIRIHMSRSAAVERLSSNPPKSRTTSSLATTALPPINGEVKFTSLGRRSSPDAGCVYPRCKPDSLISSTPQNTMPIDESWNHWDCS